jgi:hypothetical protein
MNLCRRSLRESTCFRRAKDDIAFQRLTVRFQSVFGDVVEEQRAVARTARGTSAAGGEHRRRRLGHQPQLRQIPIQIPPLLRDQHDESLFRSQIRNAKSTGSGIHGGRESFSGKRLSIWFVVARKRLPTPFALRNTNPNPTVIVLPVLRALSCLRVLSNRHSASWAKRDFKSAISHAPRLAAGPTSAPVRPSTTRRKSRSG